MKKLTIFCLCFFSIIFPQENYQAKLVIEQIYWQNDDEWGANLRGDLYIDGQFLEPSINYYYSWERKIEETGLWEVRYAGFGDYLCGTDGHQNQIFYWRLRITGTNPHFSTLSNEVEVIKYGVIAIVENVNTFKENGTSANSNIMLRIWGEYNWHDQTPGSPFFLSLDEYNVLKDSVYISFGQKFHRWEILDPAITYYKNHEGIYVGEGTNHVNVHHRTYHNASFNLASEIPSLRMSLEDPWAVKTTPTYYQAPYGYRNLGLSAIPEEVNNGIYGGIFLNQEIAANKPYYSISIPSSIYLPQTGQTHNLYLQNWNVSGASLEHENALETGVVFTSISGANISANVKATQLSDKLNGFDNSSQRKFIKTGDGVMHHVYESMGKVWYEKSTNNGGDWILMNGGKPLSNYPSKNPSIAGVSNFRVLIVFQETTQVGFFIKVLNINFLNDQILDTEQIELLQESDADVDPIIEYSVAGSPDYVVIAWKENLEGGWGDGGYYIIAGKLHGGVMGLDDIILYETSKIQIPETDYNTQNMAISKNSFHTYDNSFYLTWEQVDPESGDHSINFDSLHVISQINDADFYFYPMQTVSSISGYENHYEPSLTIMNDNIARICWVGQRQIEETDEIQSNVIFAASDNPTFFRTFGYKVNSANINRADNGNAYVIGWSEEEGEINRIVDNYLSGSHIRDLNMTGKNIQICNGSTLSNMYATAFNAGSLLYYFLQSNNIQSYYINPTKVSTTSISEGREGIVAKNKLQFYFGVGDVKVDNELVSFKEIADSVRFSNLQTLNQYLTTEPFPLTDNSSFITACSSE